MRSEIPCVDFIAQSNYNCYHYKEEIPFIIEYKDIVKKTVKKFNLEVESIYLH